MPPDVARAKTEATPKVDLVPPKADDGLQIGYEAKSYPVSGTTALEVLASLRQRGPRSDNESFFGLTETSMDLTYRYTDLEDGCVVHDVRLDLDVAVTLPEWSPSSGTDPALVDDWGQFYRALARHETTHREIAEDEAQALYRRLDGLRRGTCALLEAELRHRLQVAQRDIEVAHRDYDERTGHGRTEGAVWPVRPRGRASVEPREVR